MTKAEHKMLKNADKALADALMDLIEIGEESNSPEVRKIKEEACWQAICHARKTLALVLESGPNE
jgi:hypothetical protein